MVALKNGHAISHETKGKNTDARVCVVAMACAKLAQCHILLKQHSTVPMIDSSTQRFVSLPDSATLLMMIMLSFCLVFSRLAMLSQIVNAEGYSHHPIKLPSASNALLRLHQANYLTTGIIFMLLPITCSITAM